MRLHALILALAVLGAYAASIPDKKDIEKKLSQVVKEVLDKDEVPIDNTASAQELVEQTAEIKDIENNLRNQPAGIPVKVVVEDVQPALKSDNKKEDNEVSPEKESSEIVREEIDLKNPGPPQRMQHDTQNPETFVDGLKTVILKNSELKPSEQYALIQKELTTMKENFENKMTELYGSIQELLNARPAVAVDDQKEGGIQVRASIRQDAGSGSSSNGSGSSGTSNSTGSWGSNPIGSFFQNLATSFQQNLQSVNQTVNNYWNNNTNSNSSDNGNQCGGGAFNWGQNNPLTSFGQQQQGTGQQSDEPARPGIWQTIQQNVQNLIGGNQPPAGAQSDSPQPAQPNRPVIQAFQNVIQQAGSLFNRPGQPEPQPAVAQTAQEGSNVVPADVKPNGEKKPEQATPQPQQSGPIKQMIGSNPVVQGIAGAVQGIAGSVQRIQHSIIPTKPREEVKNAIESVPEATKGGFHSNKPSPGDNNNSDSNRVEVQTSPEEEQKPELVPQEAKEPTKEESAAVKTE